MRSVCECTRGLPCSRCFYHLFYQLMTSFTNFKQRTFCQVHVPVKFCCVDGKFCNRLHILKWKTRQIAPVLNVSSINLLTAS